jgi:hypothetical protein
MKLFQHVRGSALAIVGFMLCVSTLSVHADIRISQRGTRTLANSNRVSWTRTIEIKGLKMRLESGQGMQSRATIYDLESGKRFRLSASSKEVFELDLGPVSKRWKEAIVQNKMDRVIRPSGGKYEVSGLPCDEYTFEFQAPISLHGYEPRQIAHDRGTVCLSQTIPGGAEFASFVREAKKRGYVLAVAILSPTFSPIGSYFFGEEPNVMVLSAVTKFGYDSYPGAQNPSSTAIEETWTVTEIKSELISAEDFRVPPDWKLKGDSEFDRAALSQPTSRSQTFVRKVNSW